MSDNVAVAIIAAVPIIITQILTYLGTRRKVEQVHKIVNSNNKDLVEKMDKLTAENIQLKIDK